MREELGTRKGLEEGEDTYRRLVEAFPESIVVHSGGKLVFANPAAAKLMGAGDPCDLLGGAWIDRVHPDYRAAAKSRVARTQEGGERVELLEMKFVRLDGSAVDVEALAMPITYRGEPGTLSVARDVTARKEAEGALADSEARFRAIFEQGAIGISVVSPNKVFLGANPAYQEMLGYTEEELRGMSLADVTHPEDMPAYVDLHEEVLAGRMDGYRREKRYVRKDGGIVWARPTVSAVRDPGGGLQFLINMVENITERKRAEEALKENRDLLSAVMEGTTDAVFVKDLGGRYLMINRAGAEALGKNVGEMIGKNDAELFSPEDGREAAEEDRELMASGETRTSEDTKTAGDVTRTYLATKGPYRDGGGDVAGLFGVARDITQRKKTEEALRRSEERFRALVQNASDLITILEVDGTILYESPAVERVLGHRPEDLVGNNAFDYVHPQDRERVLATFAESMGLPSTTFPPLEFRFRHADGTWRHLEALGNNLLGDPAVRGVVINSRDVTERKAYETRLKEDEETQRRRARELDLLHRVRTALSREVYPGAVCRAVVEAVAEAYGYALVSAYLLEATGGEEEELVLQHQVGYGSPIWRIPVGHGVSGRAVRDGRAVLLEDVRKDPDFLGAIEDVASEICVPLFDSGGDRRGALGFLNVESTAGNTLTADDLRMLEAVGEHAGVALGRARLHARLQDAEERYRALVENVPAVVYVDDVNESNSVIYRSPYVREVLGYEPEEFLSYPEFWQDLLHPDDREWVLAENERTNETNEPFRIEYRMIRKDGRAVWLRDEAILIRDGEGRPKFWQGYFVDITKRKAAEARLAEAEEKYRTMVEGVPAVTYVFSQRPGGPSRATYISPQVERVLGYTQEEYTADPDLWRSLVHPQDRPRVLAEDERTGESGGTFKSEFRMVAKDGSAVWIREEGNLVRVGEDGTQTWHGVMFDVTDRKRAEEALRKSEGRFRALVQNVSDVVTVFGADARLRYASPALERVLGHRPEERIGCSPADDVHPEDVEGVWRAFDAASGGAARTVGYRCRRRDGAWVHVESVVSNLLDDPSVRGVVVNSRDVTERKAYEKRLAHQATHDPLTGLPNRRLFVDRLRRALRRADGRGGKVSVLFLDLDDFKNVNDSLGHDAGDRLLVAVTDRLKGCLRPGDTVARFGGDEFAVLLEDVDDAVGAVRVAERIEGALEVAPFKVGNRRTFVGASIGIVVADEAGHRSVDILRSADLALYEAKKQGKARHAVFDPETERRFLRRVELENGIRRALERREFVIHYQPVVSLETGRTVGFEALVRWERPGRGLVPPAEFVPVAEENGFIVPLGRWVLGEACRRAREWREIRADVQPPAVAVNVSARQLSHPSLIGDVEDALRENDLAPGSLILEVTEGVLVEDEGLHAETLKTLRKMGVRFAIDDFGTGYSSLSYLRRLPAGLIKLDGSFVAGMAEDRADEVLLSGVIGIAKGLGLGVCAEAVETAEQATRLRELGCGLAQGHHFSKPLTKEAAASFWGRQGA